MITSAVQLTVSRLPGTKIREDQFLSLDQFSGLFVRLIGIIHVTSRQNDSEQTLSEMKISYKRIPMQQYKLKRGFKPEPDRIYQVMQESFPVEISRNGDRFETSYGAISKIAVWIENKMLCVETFSDKTVNDETILQTNKAYRDFLLKSTGYTAKERLKMAKKDVGEA
jgi:hypothetical protein